MTGQGSPLTPYVLLRRSVSVTGDITTELYQVREEMDIGTNNLEGKEGVSNDFD